jgi:signal transduction histidine kinase
MAPEAYLLLLADPSRFTIVGISNGYLRAYETTRAAILGRSFFEIIPGAPRDGAATNGHNRQAAPAALQHTGTPETSVGPEMQAMQAMNQRLAVRAHELEEANRRMDNFLRIASHEFKTPVTSMKASVQLAIRSARSLGAVASSEADAGHLRRTLDLLERADQQATKLGRLIDDLLDVTRLQAGSAELRLQRADLVSIVREAVDQQRLAWPGRQIRLETPDLGSPVGEAAPLPPLVLDADRVSQVVTNFLTNALKYSPADAPIAVRITVHGGDGADHVRDRQVQVAVTDRGPGLSAGQQVQLWQLYHRVPEIRQQSGSGVGLGIGLFVCKSIIEQHHGRVGVESMPGKGSTFWFTLPIRAASDVEV